MAETIAEKKSELVQVTIDDKEVGVPAGSNLIQAAKEAGVYIPHYCYHPKLSIDGSCRLCLVEVWRPQKQRDGAVKEVRGPKLELGCDVQVSPGMKVVTNSGEVANSREGMMEFLLANHPLDCPVCDRGGECTLQRYSMDYGVAEARFVGEKRRLPKPQFDPLIDIERNRCILCTRCVRFCDEIAGDHVMGVFGRGDHSYIGTFGNQPVGNIFSGNTIDICPVGCLTSKPFRFKARVWELQQVPSTCSYCASGCEVAYWMRGGKVYRTTPPVAKGRQNYQISVDTDEFICNQGRFGSDYGTHEDRLLYPQIRRGASLVNVSWKEALDEAAAELRKALEKGGPGKIGLIASPRATLEEIYIFQRLGRVALGTNNIDWRVKFATPEAASAVGAALARSDGTLEEPYAYDVTILVEGGGLQEKVPVTALKIKEAARLGATKLFCIGSHQDWWFTKVARGALGCEPGRAGEVLKQLAGGVGEKPGTRNLVEVLLSAKKVLIAYDATYLNGLYAPELVSGVFALKTALGDRCHTLPVVAERNAVGAFAAGCQPDRLPGRWANDEALRGELTRDWSASLPDRSGLSGPEMLREAAQGNLDAMIVLGGEALAQHPQPDLV
ncbi:MAG: 2Fe-2S iron-sulfur cluster-binding protein, partial [bacterium]